MKNIDKNTVLHKDVSFLNGLFNSLFIFVGILNTDGIIIKTGENSSLWRSDFFSSPSQKTRFKSMYSFESDKGFKNGYGKSILRSNEFLGKSIEEVCAWSYLKKNKQLIRNAVKKAVLGENVRFDIKARGANKKNIHINLAISPMFSSKKKIRFLAFSAIDVTEYKLIKNKYEKQTIKLTSILENMTDAFFTLDRKWRFTYLNEQIEQVFKRSKKELLGKIIWKEFPNSVNTTFYFRVQEAMKQHIPSQFEMYYKPQNKWFDTKVYPARTGLSVYMRDVTNRKKVERRKDEFISIASHELKTPITSIKAYTQIARQDLKKRKLDNIDHYLQRMDNQVTRLVKIVDNLLNISKIQSGKLEIHKSLHDINLLIREAVEDIQSTVESHSIVVKTEVKKKITIDKSLIYRVLTNLISNAVKYSYNADKIIVYATGNKVSITVGIRDFGIGIPKKDQGKIFERYFRVSSPNKDKIPGMGLGLYISKRIINKHGGKIWVESRDGEGSTFYFTLPFKTGKKYEIF
ncbi:MAG: hypothetical protein A2857_05925 [Candidatus Levybacteria bacterium RIFCSPHIGHO2_01_FULL_36_15]|nr:MAG: hypothetical protein A2857_05925 [Candidatus Levybacteria bacterium RIFCSPHIGHO2_01_FULL_36_15]